MKKNIFMIIICIALLLLIGSIALYRITNMEVATTERKSEKENIINNNINTENNISNVTNSENNVVEEPDTGAFKNTMFEVGNYRIKVSSQKPGNPSNGSNFSTYMEYNKKDESTNISLDYFFVEGDVYKDYSDFNKYKNLSINGKNLKYKVEDNQTEAVFLYKNDEDSYLKIVMKSGLIFDNKTGYVKDTLKITNDFLKRKDVVNDLKKEIKFEIEKK